MQAPPRTPHATVAHVAVLLWFVVMAALAIWLAGRPEPQQAQLAGLVSPDHRPLAGSHVRLTLRESLRGADTAEDSASALAWAQIVDQLGPLLPGHQPLAPPPAETRAWLDAHALQWIALADHTALARRFEPAALRAVVAGVRARLASPLFVIGGEDPRRDPLGLRSLGEATPGRLGLLAPGGPTSTASGDLLAADGRTLLIHLRTTLPPLWLRATVSARLAARFDAGPEVAVEVLPVAIAAAPGSATRRDIPGLLLAGLAALVLALALGLRRVRTSLAVVLVIAVGAPLAPALAGGLDPLAAPLLLAVLAVAVALAPPVGPAGFMSSLRLAAAPLPLLLLPYPTWQRWALAWGIALLALVAAARVLTPPLLRLARARALDPRPRPAIHPWPRAAALVAVTALLAGGAWSMGHVSGDIFDADPTHAELREKFFDPLAVAELRSPAADAAAALTAAAADAAELAPLVPTAATRLDAPGALVLAEGEAEARLAGLRKLDLPGRVEQLRGILDEHGLRPDAFAEFLEALDLERLPTPAAALAGPLAGWFGAHLEPGSDEDTDRVVAVSRVFLADELPADVVLPARLRGPAVFAHREQQARRARLGLALIAGAWLSAFLIWLPTRRLSLALAAALTGVAAQAGALALAVAAGAASVVLLVPPLLLVGALAADAAARACQPVPADSSPGRPALALACQVAPAIALIASPDPAWRSFGLVLGFGAVLGHALATRAAPGLWALLRRREEARP